MNGQTSTTKPTVEAFMVHMRQCPQCKECCEAWWELKDPDYATCKEKMKLCEDGRAIMCSLFNG